MRMSDREALRRSAGIYTSLNEEKNISKIRTLDIEADLLRSFSMVLKDIKRMKHMIEEPIPQYGGMGPGPMGRMKEEQGDVDLDHLYKVSKEKLEMVEDALKDCFKEQSSKDDEEEDDEEESDEEESDDYDDDYEEDGEDY